MKKQTTSNIFMVRPANFGFNEETAKNNAFQTNDTSTSKVEIKALARQEFDDFVVKLRANGINIFVGEETPTPIRPDSVFPNNWVSFHENGLVVTYPIFSPKRRLEREESYLDELREHFQFEKRIRYEKYEEEGIYLEGTGSMIFDRQNQIAYACLSPRTDLSLMKEFCKNFDAELVVFDSTDKEGIDIYHTNVMMALGETFVIICLDTIKKEKELKEVKAAFAKTNKEIIQISMEQMGSFAGNMLQVRNNKGKTFLVMSSQAFESLNDTQIQQIEKHTNILHAPIPTIETYGGGSARCMMAEIFLEKK